MGAKSNLNFTYISYLQKLQDENNTADTEYIQQLLLQYKQLSALSIVIPSTPVLFVIDYSERQYPVFSNTLIGYSTQQILEGGLDFMLPLMQKDLFNTFNEKVFPVMLSFLASIPPAQHANYIVSFNYKIKNSHKKDIDVFQRCTYLVSKETGLPTHCIGMVLDMSLFKPDNIITLSFEKTTKETGQTTLLEQNYFYPYQEEMLLSAQEKKVLTYMADGLSTKMIAQKLNISTNTITNHRTNMLRKTNTKNVVELVMLAVRNKVL